MVTNDIVKEENIDKSNREYLTDKNADSLFSATFEITNLSKHEVYKIKDEINIDFYFTEKVGQKEIMNSRTFVMKTFVLKKQSIFGGYPYDQLLGPKADWNGVKYRAFVGNSKIIEEKFYSNKTEYFENMDVNLSIRNFDNTHAKDFCKKVKNETNGIREVILQKSLRGSVLLIKVVNNNEYQEKDINKIKELIEKELAPNLEAESIKLYGMNTDYLGLSLQLYCKDKKYYEETYFNAKKKHWFKENWMNYNYFENAYSE